MMKRGFTLIELLLVMAIMGMMGVMSVGGYRAMQRGIEERGVMENVNKFIKAAYQRCQIERSPVSIYFWNETVRDESDSSDTLSVIGKAVAVRRSGRITDIDSSGALIDEFGDLRFSRLVLDSDENEEAENVSTDRDKGTYLYPMNGSSDGSNIKRSIVSSSTVKINYSVLVNSTKTKDYDVYAFRIVDRAGVDWKVGDAYGFEFAEITLPRNYIFGSSYSQSTTSPIKEIKKLTFKVGKNTGSGSQGGFSGDSTVEVSSIRPDKSGGLSAQKIDTTDKPDK